ncbi:MAG TPA: hypothetical protein VF821_15750, partial [Lentzea sp.]
MGTPLGDIYMRMIRMSRRALAPLVAATVVATLLAPAATAAECVWQAEYLPVQDGMSWSNLRITGVDGQGNASGFYSPDRDGHTLVRWTSSGLEIVPRPDGAQRFVTIAGNAFGVVIGMAERDDSRTPMTHTPGEGYRELPTPAGYVVTGVQDVNDRGDVLGRVKPVGTEEWGVVLWRADGSAPQVIEPSVAPLLWPVALGEDGTVLL